MNVDDSSKQALVKALTQFQATSNRNRENIHQ